MCEIKTSKFTFLFLSLILICNSNVIGQTKYTISKSIDTSLLQFDSLYADMIKETDNANQEVGTYYSERMNEVFRENKGNIAVCYVYINDTFKKFKAGNVYKNFTPALVSNFDFQYSVQINTGLGFLSGMGVLITILKDRFVGSYGESSGGKKIFRYQTTDTSDISAVDVFPIKEKLILSTKPTFKNGEVVYGEYEGTFKPFYENYDGAIHEKKVRLKIIFKCSITSRKYNR